MKEYIVIINRDTRLSYERDLESVGSFEIEECSKEEMEKLVETYMLKNLSLSDDEYEYEIYIIKGSFVGIPENVKIIYEEKRAKKEADEKAKEERKEAYIKAKKEKQERKMLEDLKKKYE